MVVKVIVKDVVKSREICLNYTDSNDLGIQCSIQDLREKCAEHWCEEGMDESAYAHGLFIYQHAMLYDNQEKLFVSKASTVVVYFLATAFPLPNEHKVHFTIDEVSMKAASEWLNVGSEQVVNPVTSQLVMALQSKCVSFFLFSFFVVFGLNINVFDC